MKYFLHLAYKGTDYQGWQRQTNSIGIQAVLEDQLSKLFKQKILLHGCGRTDSGVHAKQYFCHTTIDKEWDFDAVFRMNKILPPDITVFEFIPVPAKSNAQLDVITRTYEYNIHFSNDPFLEEFSTLYLINNPNIIGMQAATKFLLQYKDYRSFCKQPDLYKHTLCEVSVATLMVHSNKNQLCFRITANRFLRSMVRRIVGHLIAIAKREMSVDDFENLLKTPQLAESPNVAYPQGLFLSKVIYPYLERDI